MNEAAGNSITSEKPDKKTLREFSKTVNPITRYSKTYEVLQERQFRASEIKRLGSQIEREEDNLNLRQPKAEKIEAEIQEIEADIALIKTNLVLRTFQQGKLEKLQQKKHAIKSSEEYDDIKYYHYTKEKLDQLRQTLNLERQHNKAKELLRAFYKDQSEDWLRYQEDLRESSVENIIRKYGVVFVHGITDETHLEHSFVSIPLPWEDKLSINLTIGPTLSVSAIKEGCTIDDIFARCGIISNGGRVTEASPCDLGSISKSFSSKASYQPEEHGYMAGEIKYTIGVLEDKLQKKEEIDKRIPRCSAINEFIVNNPRVCGVYFCLDNSELKHKFIDVNDYPEIARVEAIIKEIKIPFYALKNGVVYEAKIENGEIKVLNPVKPEELAQRKYELPEEIKRKQLSRLMEKCPFRLTIPEVWLIESMAQGKMTYIELNPPSEPISFPGVFETVSFSYDKSGRLVCTKRRAIDQQKNEYNLVSDFWSLENGVVDLGYTNEHSKSPIINNETYLQAMEEIISNVKERLKGISSQSYLAKERYVDRIAFHLYSYGEQAEINGEQEIKNRAFGLASQILTYEEYLRIIRQRVGPDGEFKMIPEDLKN